MNSLNVWNIFDTAVCDIWRKFSSFCIVALSVQNFVCEFLVVACYDVPRTCIV